MVEEKIDSQTLTLRAGEVAQWLRAHTGSACREPSIYMVAHKPRESGDLFWPPRAPGTHLVHRLPYRQNIHTHKIKMNLFVKVDL